MRVTLAPKQAAMVNRLVKTGRYASGQEVVKAGLKVLVEKEEQNRLDETRKKLQEGLDALDRGEFFTAEEARRELDKRREKFLRKKALRK